MELTKKQKRTIYWIINKLLWVVWIALVVSLFFGAEYIMEHDGIDYDTTNDVAGIGMGFLIFAAIGGFGLFWLDDKLACHWFHDGRY